MYSNHFAEITLWKFFVRVEKIFLFSLKEILRNYEENLVLTIGEFSNMQVTYQQRFSKKILLNFVKCVIKFLINCEKKFSKKLF